MCDGCWTRQVETSGRLCVDVSINRSIAAISILYKWLLLQLHWVALQICHHVGNAIQVEWLLFRHSLRA